MKIEYKIDGTDFSSLGVYVTLSTGLIDGLKPKPKNTTLWPDHHGAIVSKKRTYYEPRQIELNCFIKADNNSDLITNINAFTSLLAGEGLKTFTVKIGDNDPLIFLVHISNGITLNKRFSQAHIVGTFTLNMIEPEPIKGVYKLTGNFARILIDGGLKNIYNIYWGDGTSSLDIPGIESGYYPAQEHSYEQSGDYYIIVTGDIDTAVITPSQDIELLWKILS